MELTLEQLKQIIPRNQYTSYWHEALAQLLPEYQIDTPQRIAAFLAQCAHESGNFVFIKENLNYRAPTLRKVFPKYFPTDELAQQYANKPEKIANRVYANRMGNGPEDSGDGWLYCGRGLIQVTGKDNYSWFAASLRFRHRKLVSIWKLLKVLLKVPAGFGKQIILIVGQISKIS